MKNKVAIYWGGASLKNYLDLHPNELLFWYAMKRIKDKGVDVLHMGGGAKEFKRKLGSYEAQVLRLMKPRYRLLNIPLGDRHIAKKIHCE